MQADKSGIHIRLVYSPTVALFAQRLAHEREEDVGEAAQLELVVADGRGGGAAA